MDTRLSKQASHGNPVGLIGTVLTLGTPQDITLQELRVEMFMPADEASEATLVGLSR